MPEAAALAAACADSVANTATASATGTDAGTGTGTGTVAAAAAAAAAAATSAAAVQIFLAFDFGTRRIGVASGNTLLKQGQGRGTLRVAPGSQAHFAEVAKLIAEWLPAALVVGVPFHPDGAEHDNTARARRFARQLHGRFRLPVHEVDERYSTTEAVASGAHDADSASAAIILTQFLNPLPDTDTDTDTATATATATAAAAHAAA